MSACHHASRLWPALVALGALSAQFPAHADPSLDLYFGVDYSSGDYGEATDTDILFLPLAIKYSREQWSAKASFAWLRLDGPGTVTADGVVVRPGEANRDSESGPGDTWLSLSYALDTAPGSRDFFDLTAKIKLPTADESRGLGTGETDYAVQLDAMRAMDALTPFATLGYRLMGDPPDIDYDDVGYFSIGADWRVDDLHNFGLIYDYRQAATDTSDDVSEFSAYLNRRFDPRWSANLYGVLGASDGSPDYAIGLQVRRRLR